jgi:hypothetical protein
MDWGDVRTIGEPLTERGDLTADLSGWSLPVLPEWEMAPDGPPPPSGNARSLFFSDFVEAD